MDKYSHNGHAQLEMYETPFADTEVMRETEEQYESSSTNQNQFLADFESPFTVSYESGQNGLSVSSEAAGDFVNLLGELHNDEFGEQLYEMAAELEDTWNNKISNETAMGERFIPFATQEAQRYFEPLLNETTRMIDHVSRRFSGNNFDDQSEAEIERFFQTLEAEHNQLSPAQEQFFGSIMKKVKSVVNTGVKLAKKGVAAVGKILPIGPILQKLKGLINPLLDKVLKFAIGKLPKNLQPYAQTLAKKFLKLETSGETISDSEDIPSTGNLEAIQSELDNHITNLVFAAGEAEAEDLVMEYESSTDTLQREANYESGGLNIPSLDVARQQFIDELKNLKEGESPAPAIERFLPAAILALQPVIKIAISIIGRQKVINFLAGLLAKLVAKYVPENIARPLAASIIDVGMSAIGFETHERNRTDLAYEAIANTIQDTIQNLGSINEETLNDQESLMAETLEAFERAASNNFPSNQLKESKRLTIDTGTWVMMPRSGSKHLYKKYTRVFETTLDSRLTSMLTSFRGVPLSNYLKDKLGLDVTKPVKARVHIYEGIPGTKLYMINRFEKVPGLGIRFGYKQFHPLTVQAATILLKEPKLGRDLPPQYTSKRHQMAVGQRFYYLEIPGAQLKMVPIAKSSQTDKAEMSGHQPAVQNYTVNVPHSSDIQGVINFVKAEIRFNYYFSEEDAKSVAEKLNAKDYAGAFISIRYSIRSVLHNILIRNVGSKVKIVHEMMPEMFLENYEDKQEHFSWGAIGSAISGAAMNAGKAVIQKLIEKLIDKIADMAYQAVVNYFKARVNEFISAQSAPRDGVTLKVVWFNVPGMSSLSAIISAFKGRLSVGNVADLVLPSLPAPDVQISAGKNFD